MRKQTTSVEDLRIERAEENVSCMVDVINRLDEELTDAHTKITELGGAIETLKAILREHRT